eukprot:c15275_g1_i1.p1 GENE.c15275_g1_i1~~c15275_g1_i1.p1  ORF type:complete len:270 (+),score=58.95 c15275_g1_i1:105-914(+)
METTKEVKISSFDADFVDCVEEMKGFENFVQSIKPGAAETALQNCLQHLNNSDQLKYISSFFLDQINHYLFQQERVLIITKDALFRVQYDFNTHSYVKHVTIPFQAIQKIQKGKLVVSSVLQSCQPINPMNDFQGQIGVRVYTALDPPPVVQQWSPKTYSFPFSTYTAHSPTRLFSQTKDYHSITKFYECLVDAVNNYDRLMGVQVADKFVESDIDIHGGVGALNYVYNGFEGGRSMDRKGMIQEEQKRIGKATKKVVNTIKQKYSTSQ